MASQSHGERSQLLESGLIIGDRVVTSPEGGSMVHVNATTGTLTEVVATNVNATTGTLTEVVATNVNATTGNVTETVSTNVNATTVTATTLVANTTLNTNGLDVTANTVGFFQATPSAQITVNAAANNDVDEILAQLNATIAALTTFGLFD